MNNPTGAHPYIPNAEESVRQRMLRVIGAQSVEKTVQGLQGIIYRFEQILKVGSYQETQLPILVKRHGL